MNLHQDRDAFLTIINLIGEASGIRRDVLEKDYYITLFLKELSGWQDDLPAYFKGGTALYKAMGSIRRFSEDLDLTVCIDNCTNSQAKRRLEKAAHGYGSLPRTAAKELESNQKGSITSAYDYETVVDTVISDPLQRFNHVKVEATSFTVSEPFAPMTVSPIIFDKAAPEQQSILQTRYGVAPFQVNTIRLERIFADKIFAAEFYYERDAYFDVSKHVYDLAVMSGIGAIRQLMDSPLEFSAMLAYKRREEIRRIGSDLADKPFNAFGIFREMDGNEKLRADFEAMQNIYIFDDADKLDFSKIGDSLAAIYSHLITLEN